MKVLSERKLKGGMVEFKCDFTQKELEILVSYAMSDILRKQIARKKGVKMNMGKRSAWEKIEEANHPRGKKE